PFSPTLRSSDLVNNRVLGSPLGNIYHDAKRSWHHQPSFVCLDTGHASTIYCFWLWLGSALSRPRHVGHLIGVVNLVAYWPSSQRLVCRDLFTLGVYSRMLGVPTCRPRVRRS